MSRNTDAAPDRQPAAQGGADIPFSRPSLDEKEEAAVIRVLRSGWLTTAGECLAFEKEFAAAVGTPHAVAVNSCTAGLHLALEAVGVSAGQRVVTTPYTFTSSAEVARYLDADPLFVDIREDDLNIDADLVEQAIADNEGVAAVVPVHIGGHACRMDQLSACCSHAGAALIEDAAHAFPGTSGGQPLGTLGTAGVYSFYANKTMTTGEGGMVVTGDEDIARRVRVMRLHGIDREVWNRYTSKKPGWSYQVVEAGYKYNLPDILAAIGREQLKKSTAFCEQRRGIARALLGGLGERDYLRLPPWSDESSWHLFVVRIRPEKLTISRDEFISRLAEAGIGTSVHYIPLHIMPYYRDRYGLRPEDFPVSLRAYETAISLPIYPGLSDEQVHRVIAEVIRIGDSAVRR